MTVKTCLTLTDAIFETGASGVPCKSQKSFLEIGQDATTTLLDLTLLELSKQF
jgi:hypothetical protein